MYCGEWIESHTLHIYMLHAPDFLGYPDAITMAKDYPDVVKKGLRLKKAGNEIVKLLGAREIHPINVKVGGFYKIPSKAQFLELAVDLKQARADAYDTVKWVNSFTFPQLERAYECVSVSEEKEYPIMAGRISTSSGLNISLKEFETYFEEHHVPYSTALLSLMKDKGAYLVGPMARYNLHQEKLSPIVQKTIKEIGFEKVCNNPFRSIIVRALEVLYACDEALKIIAMYDWGNEITCVPVTPKRAVGYGATEAPRGLLYHRYNLDEKGKIEVAKIVPPTAQNQKMIEEDLRDFVGQNISMPDKELTWKCEQAIRNYDPCISCSVHFLNLEHIRG
jgi:coenzyme F420-reducing hydrogenase alpha subunit